MIFSFLFILNVLPCDDFLRSMSHVNSLEAAKQEIGFYHRQVRPNELDIGVMILFKRLFKLHTLSFTEKEELELLQFLRGLK